MNLSISRLVNLLIITLLLVPYFSFGQFPPPEQSQPPSIPTSFFGCTQQDSLRVCILKILQKVLEVILVVALALAAIFIATAGFIYLTKGSDNDARKKANSMLIFAAFGLVIAFLSWVITAFLVEIIRRGTQAI